MLGWVTSIRRWLADGDGGDDGGGLAASMRAGELNETAVGTEDAQSDSKEGMLLPCGRRRRQHPRQARRTSRPERLRIETTADQCTLVRQGLEGWGTVDVMPTAAIG